VVHLCSSSSQRRLRNGCCNDDIVNSDMRWQRRACGYRSRCLGESYEGRLRDRHGIQLESQSVRHLVQAKQVTPSRCSKYDRQRCVVNRMRHGRIGWNRHGIDNAVLDVQIKGINLCQH